MIRLLFAFVCFFHVCTHANAAERSFYVENEEAKLFCRSFGEGKPIIVLHGGPGLTQDYLLPGMTELAKNHQVIFYDQRGCGQSEGVISSENITIPQYIRDLEAIRKETGHSTFILLGHSWGGFLAMQYAICHPDHLEKMILSNSMTATSEDLAMFLQEWFKRMTPILPKLNAIQDSQAFKEGDPQTVEEYYQTVFKPYCFNPESVDLLNLKLSRTAAVNGQLVKTLFNKELFEMPYDITPALLKLNIPTLVIHGDYDPIPASTAENIHKNIPHSQFILLKDCGHFPYVETPKPYFKAINDFLDE